MTNRTLTDIISHMPEDHEKQSKDAVAAAIAADPSAGPLKTVPVICQRISAAAAMNAQPKQAVVSTCRGAILAVLVSGQSVPDTTIALMEALPNISLMMRSGPEDLMSWVMDGVAQATKLAPASVRDGVRAKIEEKFMGASSIFDELCREADAK